MILLHLRCEESMAIPGYVLQAFQWQYAFEGNVIPVGSDNHEFCLISVLMSA